MKKIIAIILLLILSSCQKKDSDIEYEQNVMNEIFIDLVDTIFSDMRALKMPPPFLTDEMSDSLRNQKLNSYKIYLAKYEKRRFEIENDTNKIVIAVFDTIGRKSISERDELKNHFNIESFYESESSWEQYKIDLTKIKNSEKYDFKYYSSFPNKKDFYRNEYPFYLGGLVSFSRIQFDKDRKYGVLQGGISYGKLNGEGFMIYIKKDLNDKWIIDKLKGTWIS